MFGMIYNKDNNWEDAMNKVPMDRRATAVAMIVFGVLLIIIGIFQFFID